MEGRNGEPKCNLQPSDVDERSARLSILLLRNNTPWRQPKEDSVQLHGAWWRRYQRLTAAPTSRSHHFFRVSSSCCEDREIFPRKYHLDLPLCSEDREIFARKYQLDLRTLFSLLLKRGCDIWGSCAAERTFAVRRAHLYKWASTMWSLLCAPPSPYSRPIGPKSTLPALSTVPHDALRFCPRRRGPLCQ